MFICMFLRIHVWGVGMCVYVCVPVPMQANMFIQGKYM